MNRTVTLVSNPVYSNPSNTTIDCLVTFSDIGQHPYTASEDDPAPYGAALWAALIAGTYGSITPYVAPIMTPRQQAAAAIAAGIVVTSNATPDLDGTYPVDPATQVKLNSAITYLMMNNAFPPASATTLPWYDSAGNLHTFTSLATFKAFATALADFVAHIDIYTSSNGASGSIPSNAITIA
jgi:hypothetical protein